MLLSEGQQYPSHPNPASYLSSALDLSITHSHQVVHPPLQAYSLLSDGEKQGSRQLSCCFLAYVLTPWPFGYLSFNVEVGTKPEIMAFPHLSPPSFK